MSLKQNIIYLYFKGKHLITSKSQYQYNHGQYLYFADLNLPQAFEVHFSNKQRGESKTQIGSNKLVEIPDEYFWSGALEIYAWIYLHNGTDDGETIYEVKIPLIKRAKPTDEEPLPVQQSAIDKAIAELNNAVDITNENANKTNADKTQVATIKEEVVVLKEEIDSTASEVSQDAQSARESADASEQSAQNSAESERKALDYSDEAKSYAQSALESKNTASQKAQVATDASAEAKGYRDEAETFKNEAEQAKQNIVDYRDETKGYRDETLNLKKTVQTLKNQADETAEEIKDISDTVKEDAQSASQSASSANQSSINASQSASQAEKSANDAEESANQAEQNKTQTETFKNQSEEYKTQAGTFKSQAETFKNQAEEFKNQTETNVTHYPKIIGEYWYVWDATNGEYINTNVDANGIKGDTGRGIASIALNDDYTLTITFTDDTTYTTPSIRGQQGEKGDTGKTGESGVYIGTEEPENEDIKVWIDTDDDGTSEDLVKNIESLKKNIYKPYVVDSASGSIASFPDGADGIPLKSLVVDINPVQDLHGQDRPYPAGGWVNKFKYNASVGTQIINGVTWTLYEDGSIQVSGTASGASTFRYVLADRVEDDDFYFSGNYKFYAFPANINTADFQGGVKIGSKWYSVYADGYSRALNDADGKIVDAWFQVRADKTVNATIRPMIYPESESTPTSWSPYENICPISGWTEVGVEQSGVNAWDEEWEVGGINSINGANTNVVNAIRAKGFTRIKPLTSYYNYFGNTSGGINFQVRFYDADKNYIGYVSASGTGIGKNKEFVTPSNAHYLRFQVQAEYGTTYNHDISINYPSTDHDYHPYTGRSITIDLGQTVYGGKLDVLTGKLAIDRAIAVFDGKETYNNNYFPTVVCNKNFTKGDASGNSFVNSHLPSLNMACNYASSTKQTFQYGKVNEYWGVSSADELKAIFAQQYANGTPVTICYPLAEPIEIQLSANQINSLLGVNNIWADTGDCAVEYRADTKLYINKKIAEALASLT